MISKFNSNAVKNIIAIIPPYEIYGPPAGSAALLGYLKKMGCYDFEFLDLRLFTLNPIEPTYKLVGAFAESYVADIPDLPLVLMVLSNVIKKEPLYSFDEECFQEYCIERCINPSHLNNYIRQIHNVTEAVFSELPNLNIVGFSIWTSNYLTTLIAAALLKKRRNPPFIVAGGPQVSHSIAAAKLGLKSGLFDCVVIGEGEETFHEIYQNYDPLNRELVKCVPGALTCDIRTNSLVYEKRDPLDLNVLPMPDFSQMDLSAYRVGGKQTVPYQLSRGCTNRCSFCSESVFWGHYRQLNPDKVLHEMEKLQHLYSAQVIHFTDSLLNASIKNLVALAEGLLSRELHLTWNGFMRADMDYETARMLKRAGCDWVFIGVESLSDSTLDNMNKRRTANQNITSIEAFLDAEIGVIVGLIPGFPGDKHFADTIRQLLKMKKKYQGLTAHCEHFTISPGQPIYTNPEHYGLSVARWPEKIRSLAPDYVDITKEILWKVEGPNQGILRSGQFEITETVFGWDYYISDPIESLTSDQIEYTYLEQGVWLGRFFAQTGNLFGLILDTKDRERFKFIKHKRGKPVELDPLVKDVVNQHYHNISSSSNIVFHRQPRPIKRASIKQIAFGLNRHTIVRLLKDHWCMVNIRNLEYAFLDTKEPLAQWLVNPKHNVGHVMPSLFEKGILVYMEPKRISDCQTVTE